MPTNREYEYDSFYDLRIIQHMFIILSYLFKI